LTNPIAFINIRNNMTERKGDQSELREEINPDVFKAADMVCDGYYMRDPSCTRKDAQEAAIAAMKATRVVDSLCQTQFGKTDSFAIKRLINLGIDPETLDVKPDSSQEKKTK
jgi:hypothetical protein